MDQYEYYDGIDTQVPTPNKIVKNTIEQEITDQQLSLDNPIFNEDEDIDMDMNQDQDQDKNENEKTSQFIKTGLKRCLDGNHKHDISNQKYITARIDEELKKTNK